MHTYIHTYIHTYVHTCKHAYAAGVPCDSAAKPENKKTRLLQKVPPEGLQIAAYAARTFKAHEGVPTAGRRARQGASSGKTPRLTKVFQLRAHKLTKRQTAAASTAQHQGSEQEGEVGRALVF